MDQQTNETPSENAPSLGITDLVVLLNVVKAAADRGAIKAEEMSIVGSVYEKLGKFLQASGVFNQPPAPSSDQ